MPIQGPGALMEQTQMLPTSGYVGQNMEQTQMLPTSGYMPPVEQCQMVPASGYMPQSGYYGEQHQMPPASGYMGNSMENTQMLPGTGCVSQSMDATQMIPASGCFSQSMDATQMIPASGCVQSMDATQMIPASGYVGQNMEATQMLPGSQVLPTSGYMGSSMEHTQMLPGSGCVAQSSMLQPIAEAAEFRSGVLTPGPVASGVIGTQAWDQPAGTMAVPMVQQWDSEEYGRPGQQAVVAMAGNYEQAMQGWDQFAGMGTGSIMHSQTNSSSNNSHNVNACNQSWDGMAAMTGSLHGYGGYGQSYQSCSASMLGGQAGLPPRSMSQSGACPSMPPRSMGSQLPMSNASCRLPPTAASTGGQAGGWSSASSDITAPPGSGMHLPGTHVPGSGMHMPGTHVPGSSMMGSQLPGSMMGCQIPSTNLEVLAMKGCHPGQQEMAMPTSSYQLPPGAQQPYPMQQSAAHLESASMQQQGVFDMIDRNHDGVITREEFVNAQMGGQAHIEPGNFQRPGGCIQVPVETASYQMAQGAPHQVPPWHPAMNSPQAQGAPVLPQTMIPRQEPMQQFPQQCYSGRGGPGGSASARGVSTPRNFLRNHSDGSDGSFIGRRQDSFPRTSSFLVPKGSLGPHRAERDGGCLFRALDLNHDGVVSDDEVQQFVAIRHQQRLQQQMQQQQQLQQQHLQHPGQGHQQCMGPPGHPPNHPGSHQNMGPHAANFHGPPGVHPKGFTPGPGRPMPPGGWGLHRDISFSEASSASEDCCTRD